MKIISLFAGAGGLDIGFKQAGFNTIWANEYDKSIWNTFEKNFQNTFLDKRSIVDIDPKDIPETVGIIGGPPCQSWSIGGSSRGIKDKRGKLFYEYIRILKDKQPLFFLAENVHGMLNKKHSESLNNIISELSSANYNVSMKSINANDYGVAQDRKRIFFIGYRKDINIEFNFPKPLSHKPILKDIIYNIKDSSLPAKELNISNGNLCHINSHEYMTGGFSSMYMSRNRVRTWNEPSFTIQAGGRHAPIHPQAPLMIKTDKDKRIFKPNEEHLYRRLSIRECARIQSFPDEHIFVYNKLSDGYKMVGNAVPPKLAKVLAMQIYKDLKAINTTSNKRS